MIEQRLQQLQDDVLAISARITEQKAKDPDHQVALAMFQADLRRAEQLLEACRLQLPGRRTFIDGRRVA